MNNNVDDDNEEAVVVETALSMFTKGTNYTLTSKCVVVYCFLLLYLVCFIIHCVHYLLYSEKEHVIGNR